MSQIHFTSGGALTWYVAPQVAQTRSSTWASRPSTAAIVPGSASQARAEEAGLRVLDTNAAAAEAGLLDGNIVIDAKSGISGAGRGAGTDYLFTELEGGTKAYALGGHRHAHSGGRLLRRRGGLHVRLLLRRIGGLGLTELGLDPSPLLTGSFGARTFPHRHGTEGFFFCVLWRRK